MDIELEQNQKYEAKFSLGLALGAITANDTIAKHLRDTGFSFIQVKGNGSDRVATGVWAKPTQRAPKLPAVIKLVSINKV